MKLYITVDPRLLVIVFLNLAGRHAYIIIIQSNVVGQDECYIFKHVIQYCPKVHQKDWAQVITTLFCMSTNDSQYILMAKKEDA